MASNRSGPERGCATLPAICDQTVNPCMGPYGVGQMQLTPVSPGTAFPTQHQNCGGTRQIVPGVCGGTKGRGPTVRNVNAQNPTNRMLRTDVMSASPL